jgi:hypothetical protein
MWVTVRDSADTVYFNEDAEIAMEVAAETTKDYEAILEVQTFKI